ncbi:VTT domain-containing protein [Candidatus Pacearchaeota archaeon]|nr:hypothetical protein [uncultured archaeon]AQS33220.1 hypothetical protein [uncultured archaeon]MBS3091560.1 VTT domain-containing protein [Candidatus Pacearchaeota archaeon]
MNTLGVIILLLVQYSYWIVSLAALLGGEELLIFFSILSGHGLLSIWAVAVIGFLGILISDIFWFFIARTKTFERLKNKSKRYALYKHATNIIKKFSHENDFLYLLFTKFLYGLRIISVLRVSRRKKSFWMFLLLDALAILIWSAIMLSLGWFIGNTFFTAINIFEDLHKIALLAISVIVALYVVESVIKKKLQR